MAPRVVFIQPNRSSPVPWARVLKTGVVVFAVNIALVAAWRAADWPGEGVVRSVAMGFGFAIGAKIGAIGRLRGPRLASTLVIGAVGSLAMYFVIISR